MKQANEAIYSRLSLDGTLGALLSTTTSIAPEVVPDLMDLPAVVYQFQPGSTDEYTFTGRAWEQLTYVIKGITQGLDDTPGEAIAAQIDALFTDPSGWSISGHTVMRCRRVSRIRYLERGEAGAADSYWHIGGRYVLEVDPSG